MATSRCGVDIWVHVFGTFTVKVLPNGVEHGRIRYKHVFSGPGGSVSVNHIENVKYTATTSPDGTLVETIKATGQLLYHTVVPGHGTINNNSGHEIIQITWQYDEELGEYVEVDFQVLFEAGPDNNFDDAFWAVILRAARLTPTAGTSEIADGASAVRDLYVRCGTVESSSSKPPATSPTMPPSPTAPNRRSRISNR